MNGTLDTADKGKMERESLLQRIGVELTQLIETDDARLDKILEHLRIVLRERVNIDQGLAQVSEMFFQYLNSHPEQKSSAANCQQLSAALQKLMQEIQVPVANYTDAQTLVVAAGRAKSQPELLDVLQRGEKLLRSVNEVVANETPPVPAPSVTDRDKANKKSWLKKISRKGDLSVVEVFNALRPVLDKVLDNVGLLDDVSRQVIIIKSQLQDVSDPQQMHQILEQVLELLGGISRNISKERKDTEQFLGQLRERLQGIEQGIVGTLDNTSLGRAEALHGNIDEQVTGLQQALSGEDTLDGLRQLIATRVEKIGGTLNKYLESELEKHQQAERKVRDLTRKLREMELEGQQLRAKVHEKQNAASRDSLTGVLNRFGYEERVLEEFARSRRIGFPLSMVVVDVDRFKNVNDSYGHKAGDLVLQKVVEVISGSIRKTDCLARFGGDEFIILLPDTNAEGAMIVAEKARFGVERCGFHSGGQPVSVTICCGVTEVKDDDTPESAFERADQCMYKAKRNNRNNCKMV